MALKLVIIIILKYTCMDMYLYIMQTQTFILDAINFNLSLHSPNCIALHYVLKLQF